MEFPARRPSSALADAWANPLDEREKAAERRLSIRVYQRVRSSVHCTGNDEPTGTFQQLVCAGECARSFGWPISIYRPASDEQLAEFLPRPFSMKQII